MVATSPSGSESRVRVASASPIEISNERTNGRTDATPNNERDHPPLSATCARVQAIDIDIPTLSDVLADGIAGTGQRYDVIRMGEREPIPYHVRAAVWLRDRGICQKCYARNPKPWELDHIVPWSAGGSDESTNLRVLCQPCNQERSNYDDGTTFAKLPVTWWCQRCYVDPVRWIYDHPRGVYCPTHRHNLCDYAAACAVERIYQWQRENDEVPDWHERRPVEVLTTLAHCAHCGTRGMTDVTL